ncbi:MAG: LLM class flavin-dependent oxidoreductase, partial [Dehalococcoidia bacterium]
GFADELDAVSQAWAEGDQARARSLVPAALVDSMSIVGTPEECRERIQAYRQVGITLPIVSFSVDREGALEQAKEVIRACAPR